MEDARNTNPDEQLPVEKLQEVSGGVNTFEEVTQNITHLDPIHLKTQETLRESIVEELDNQKKGV